MEETRQHSALAAQKRLRWFALHLIGYIVVSSGAFGLHLLLQPPTPWFLLPVVGWGAVLALHVAYVMGLFGVFSEK